MTPGTSWQIQLSGPLDETVLDQVDNSRKMYDVDLFDTDAAAIGRLQAKGIAVACYFSAGSLEDWRPDYSEFPSSVKGKALAGWKGEFWLDVRQRDTLAKIMAERMELARTKGCDGVDPDNVDGYANDSGFPLTAADQLEYNRMLASMAHERGLSIGLKNDVGQAAALEPEFDWAVNEECFDRDECGIYGVFVQNNKAVFGIEYNLPASSFCPKANSAAFDFLLKGLDLGAQPRTACRETG